MEKIDPGPGYRLLEIGEVIPEGFDRFADHRDPPRWENWDELVGSNCTVIVGQTVADYHMPFRVKVPQDTKDPGWTASIEVSTDLPAPKDPSTKYHRAIYGAWNDPEVHEDAHGRKYLNVDVYSVLAAFAPDHPTGHAVKKLLCAGNRDKGSKIQDLKEAIVAIEAAIYAAEVAG